jgi:NAD(P)-dependent dehydrogenase (short-subunit alcohol dehydrogenase family)
MKARNASVAVIGAGDYIGAAIARKFAAEGCIVFAGRRRGEKLAPLVAEIEDADGRIAGRTLDARQEDQIAAFMGDADAAAPLEICIFNIGANVNLPLLETTERVFQQGLGAWLLCRVPDRVRGGTADAGARPCAIFFTGRCR